MGTGEMKIGSLLLRLGQTPHAELFGLGEIQLIEVNMW